jgi:hypothetical protein
VVFLDWSVEINVKYEWSTNEVRWGTNEVRWSTNEVRWSTHSWILAFPPWLHQYRIPSIHDNIMGRKYNYFIGWILSMKRKQCIISVWYNLLLWKLSFRSRKPTANKYDMHCNGDLFSFYILVCYHHSLLKIKLFIYHLHNIYRNQYHSFKVAS